MKLIYKYKLIIILILGLISSISTTKAFLDAQNISFDFHFSPAKLVAEGINHYQYILDGNHDHGPNDNMLGKNQSDPSSIFRAMKFIKKIR